MQVFTSSFFITYTTTHIWLLFTWALIILVGLARCLYYRFDALTQRVQVILKQPHKIAKHVDILKRVNIHDSDDACFDLLVLQTVMTEYPHLINYINSTDPQVYCKLYQINHDILKHMPTISEPIALALIKLDYKCLPTILLKLEASDEFLIKAVQVNAYSILLIPQPTPPMYEMAVANHHVLELLAMDDASVVTHVKNMTNHLCVKLWRTSPQVLDHVTMNGDLYLELVALDYKVFKRVCNASSEFYKEVIKVDARVIAFIKTPSDELCTFAITHLIKQGRLG